MVVIAILGVLAAVSIIVINPAQILAQARDAQRINDLRSVHSALSLFLINPTDTTLTAGPFSSAAEATLCAFTDVASPVPAATELCTFRPPPATFLVNGTGWVAANLNNNDGGSPLATLPRDPVNTTHFFYAFKANNIVKTYELNTRLESLRYRPMMELDGGNRNTNCEVALTDPLIRNCFYEIGNDPGLDL